MKSNSFLKKIKLIIILFLLFSCGINQNENKYFFNTQLSQKYSFKGTYYHTEAKNESNVQVIEKDISGILYVKELVKLKKGILYNLNFILDKREFEDRQLELILWVTKDKIFEFTRNPLDSFENFLNNKNIFDNNKYINYLEENNKLPSEDSTLMIYSSTDSKINDDLNEYKISNIGSKCNFNYFHNSGHYSSFTWEEGLGLTYYSFGYGAGESGIKIYIENVPELNKNKSSKNKENFQEKRDNTKIGCSGFGNQSCINKVRDNFTKSGKQILGEEYFNNGQFGISFLDPSVGQVFNSKVSTDCNCNVTNVQISMMR